MKSLKTDDNGGMPFEGNDLEWMTLGMLEALDRIVQAFGEAGNSTVILSGVEATDAGGGTTNISAGVVSVGGKICLYAGGSTISLNTPLFSLTETFSVQGNEEFEDTVVRDTYRVDTATLTFPGTPLLNQAVFIDFINKVMPRIKDGVNAFSIVEDWVTPALGGSWVTPAAPWSPGGDTDLQYRLAEGGRVEFAGSMGHPAAATAILFNLPVGYRPDKRVYLPLLIDGGSGTVRDQSLRIDTNGDVLLGDAYTLTSAGNYNCEGISFHLVRGV